MDDKVLVIYDGDCRFCRFGIDVVHRVDLLGALEFCPFGHPPAEEHLEALPEDERYTSFHAVAGGLLHSATDAARVVLGSLPFGRVAVAAGLHHGYKLLARYRGVLGRYVPDRPALITVTEPVEADV
jgi:predicted DCC family thiol-disulfide oxidoreductase YuxK